jgi:hypothetical protein
VDEELENKANFCVHWGLTFGKHLSKCWWPIKDKYLEMEWTSEDDDVRIYWFDTFHYADTQSEWSLDKVIEHTKEMAKAFFMCFLEKRPLTMDIFDECWEQ